MSVMTAEKFLQLLARYPSLRQQFYVTQPRTLEEVVQFARGKGYIITLDELKEAMESYPNVIETHDPTRLPERTQSSS